MISHVIGSLNSLKSVNKVIRQHHKNFQIPQTTVVKKLFEEDDPQEEVGDSDEPEAPHEERKSSHEPQLSPQGKEQLELEISSAEEQILEKKQSTELPVAEQPIFTIENSGA